MPVTYEVMEGLTGPSPVARIAGRDPTLDQSGLRSTRKLEPVSANPLDCGAVAVPNRRVH